MMIDGYIIFAFLTAILVYTIAKEIEEFGGCHRGSSVDARYCNDENSVYLTNTKMNSEDSCEDMIHRMKSIIRYHEKGAVWRRCFCFSVLIVVFVYIAEMNSKFKNIYHYVIILLLTFTLLYCYHNYLNYHHFRKLKRNGVEILGRMQHRCFKN